MRTLAAPTVLFVVAAAFAAPPAAGQCRTFIGFEPIAPADRSEVPVLPEFRFFDPVDGRRAPTFALQSVDDEDDFQVLTAIDRSVNVLQAQVPLRPGEDYELLLQDRFCDEDCGGDDILRLTATDRAWPQPPAPTITNVTQVDPWTVDLCHSEDNLFDGTSETAAWIHVELDALPTNDERLELVVRFEDGTLNTTREVVGRFPTASTGQGPGGVILVPNPPRAASAVVEARLVGLDGAAGPARTTEFPIAQRGIAGGCTAGPSGSVSAAALGLVLGGLALRRRRRRVRRSLRIRYCSTF